MKYSYAQKSLVWSALSLPAALVAGKIVEAVLKSTNPAQVDITAGLAYLAHIILTSFFVLLFCWIMAAVSLWLARRNGEESNQIRLAVMILATVIALAVLALVLNGITNQKMEQAKALKQTNQYL